MLNQRHVVRRHAGRSAFPVSKGYAEQKEKSEGWKLLWPKSPVLESAPGSRPDSVGNHRESGGDAPMAIGQSSDSTIADPQAEGKIDDFGETGAIDDAIVDEIVRLNQLVSSDAERYSRETDAMMSDEMNDGVRPPQGINRGNIKRLDALRNEHPREALYQKAQAEKDGVHWADNAGKRKSADNAMRILRDGGSIESAAAALRETDDDRRRAKDLSEHEKLLRRMQDSGEWEIGMLPPWNSPEEKSMKESGFRSYRADVNGNPVENRLTGSVFARRLTEQEMKAFDVSPKQEKSNTSGKRVDGDDTAKQDKPEPAYTRERGEAYARRMTAQGLPSKVVPHPTEKGKFAIMPDETDSGVAMFSRSGSPLDGGISVESVREATEKLLDGLKSAPRLGLSGVLPNSRSKPPPTRAGSIGRVSSGWLRVESEARKMYGKSPSMNLLILACEGSSVLGWMMRLLLFMRLTLVCGCWRERGSTRIQT